MQSKFRYLPQPAAAFLLRQIKRNFWAADTTRVAENTLVFLTDIGPLAQDTDGPPGNAGKEEKENKKKKKPKTA